MWLKWLPWRMILKRVAKSYGFIDPINVLSQMHRFAQPSEVTEPIELLRAGVIFHARGMINTRAIQHNLDWVWPYWIEQQFNPRSPSFIPRAFSATHVNLTHRNWTAVGRPGSRDYPIVDPRGLVTPHEDGWSVDVWLVGDDTNPLIPSRCDDTQQVLGMDGNLAVETYSRASDMTLARRTEVIHHCDGLFCHTMITGRMPAAGWLVVTVRPVNPEGVSFIQECEASPDKRELKVNRKDVITFDKPADVVLTSTYEKGDVFQKAVRTNPRGKEQLTIRCPVGMSTAAMLYRMNENQDKTLTMDVPVAGRISVSSKHRADSQPAALNDWDAALTGTCRLQCDFTRLQYLYNAAVRTLVLHSPDDVYPGPFTYKRFWFRDAAYIINAMLAVGLFDQCERALNRFPERQTFSGYFKSQDGEWDSNGQAIWIIDQFRRITGRTLNDTLLNAVRKGADWIIRKRTRPGPQADHDGLMPAGFSAEHLGPNDYYYWDDYWSVAGLRVASELIGETGELVAKQHYRDQADDLFNCIQRSLNRSRHRRDRDGIPASPYRRMDSGAIGGMPAGYPLQIVPTDDPALLDTASFLLDQCMVSGGFFQDMIHSGINPYLTLHLAQVLLRAGDLRYRELMTAVMAMASNTGQWPEAIHPATRGGCMGDGQHVWAAAEWVMMVRNCFIREEGQSLILGSGFQEAWLDDGKPLVFGPAPTRFGTVTVSLARLDESQVRIDWSMMDKRRTPKIQAALPMGREMSFSLDEQYAIYDITHTGQEETVTTGRMTE